MPLATLAPGLLEVGGRLIDRLVPDPAEREKAKLALLQAEGQLALQEMQTSLSAIMAEASSADPWTSRARPTFLYVMYGVILLCVLGAIIGIWWPAHVFQAAENLGKLLNAIAFLPKAGARTSPVIHCRRSIHGYLINLFTAPWPSSTSPKARPQNSWASR